MLITYHAETLTPLCLHSIYPEGYETVLEEQGAPFVKVDEGQLDIWEVEILPGGVFRRRQPLAPEYAASMTVGAESRIEGLPAGLDVSINGNHVGVTDGAAIEFTPEHIGAYWFKFSGSGWVTKEIKIEAVGGN